MMISSQIDIQNQIYAAAVQELEKLQREMNGEKVAQRRRQYRKHTVIMGGLLLSSLMSALATQAYMPPLTRPLSAPEEEALQSLIGYVAHKKAANTDLIEHSMLVFFDVDNLRDLRGADYDAAISYLLKLAS